VSYVTDAGVLLAVDGNSLVHRAFHALASTGMRSPAGEPIWAVRGLLSQLASAADRIGPAAILVGFDDPAVSIRRERWPQYKAHRVEKLETLISQLDLAARTLAELGIHVVTPAGLEADDVLAAAATAAGDLGMRTVIATSDRDAFALIDERTSVLRIINGGVEASPILTPARLVTLLGIRPCQYRDFAALRGDPSDNLPGVRGVGPKTAAKLLATFDTAEALFADLDSGGDRVRGLVGPGIAARLATTDARQAWRLNCEVMTFHAHIELALDLTGGPGVLPLAGDRVREAYRAQQLPATVPVALRALCHIEVEGPEPVIADNLNWDPTAQWRARRPRALPALPARKIVQTAQLALF
jgi:DNA polymerase-1